MLFLTARQIHHKRKKTNARDEDAGTRILEFANGRCGVQGDTIRDGDVGPALSPAVGELERVVAGHRKR